MKRSAALALGLSLLAAFPAAAAEQDSAAALIEVAVQPYAELEFLTPNLLYLLIPPSKSTVNTSAAVRFQVSGNAVATVVAEPGEFIEIPGDEGGWMGEAKKGAARIGYQIQVTFPSNVVVGSPRRVATLPLTGPVGTPPLSVDLTRSSGKRPGTIDLLASPDWTIEGGLPEAGLYVGSVVLTVTASDL